MAVFKPTGTSEAMLRAIKPHIRGGTLLDLGCGEGVLGYQLSGQVDKVYASDISPDAVAHVEKTYPSINVRQGHLFAPWNMRFDTIVDDVSGVAEDIAKVSPWFDGVPCQSGYDGADLVVNMLTHAPDHLKYDGKLFFPIVSLSNVNRIKDTARHLFEVELLAHIDFPLPKEMYKYFDLLRGLKCKGIEFKEKFGLIIFYTEIYKATICK